MRTIERLYTVSEIKRMVIDIYNNREDVVETFLRNDRLYVLQDNDEWFSIPLSDKHMKMLIYTIAETWEDKQLKSYTFDRYKNLVTLEIIEEE